MLIFMRMFSNLIFFLFQKSGSQRLWFPEYPLFVLQFSWAYASSANYFLIQGTYLFIFMYILI